MKSKLSVIFSLAVVLLIAAASTAFASEEQSEEAVAIGAAGTAFSVATLQEVEIQVTVPSTKKLYINPLGFPVKIGEETDTSQIITDPAYIENLGDTPVSVSVSVTGSINEGSIMTLSSSSTKGVTTTGKKAFIYFELKAVSDPDQVAWDKEYDIEKHVPVRVATKTRKNIIMLDEAGGNKPYGAFRLTGDCVARPKIPWTTSDGIKAVVAFTFKPVVTIE